MGRNRDYVAERESHEIVMVKANCRELSEMLVEATCYKRLIRHLRGFSKQNTQQKARRILGELPQPYGSPS